MPVIKVNGMHCGNCKNAVEKAAKSVPGVKSATVDLDKKTLTYEWEEGKAMDEEIVKEAIRDIGFDPDSDE